MTRIFTALTAAALLTATAGAALAERDNSPSNVTFGTQVEVRAGSVLNSKDLSRRGLRADDTITVTQAPAGSADAVREGSR